MTNQHPGMLPGLRLDGFGPKEREIAGNLATVWFVAHAGIFQASRSANYPYIFLKPTHDLREKFNFRSDILCIFHPYPDIDSRLMAAAEKIISDDPMRLDRLCVILVTNAKSISKHDFPVAAESDPRLYIPFKYSDLSGGAGGKLDLTTSALEKNLYTTDLFAISSALQTDRYFFGRKNELQALVRKYQAGENSTIFGLRRIGKTSLLWALVRELKHLGAPVAFIDCSDTRYHRAKWNKALFRIKEQLCVAGGLHNFGNPESKYSEQDASICFSEDLKEIKKRTGKPALLIFDEIENLCFELSPSTDWRDGSEFLPFWQTIRSTFQQNPNLISFLLCGVNPQILERSRLANGVDNPLYEYIKPTYLGFFDVDDVRTMLTSIGGYMGVSFDTEVFTYLTDDFGGHPFLIRHACGHMWKALSSALLPRKIHIRKQTYTTQRAEISTHTQSYINLILEVLTEKYPEEYALLQHIAAGEHQKIDHFLQENPTLLNHLNGYGLISKDGGSYFFRINAVENSIKQEARGLICPDSIEERWASLSKERNSFEHSLRDLVRRTLKLAFGSTIGKQKIIESMTKQSQREKANNLPFDDIFKGELYFLNLKDAIIKNWDIFKFAFNEDKGRFNSSMDVSNKYRADAHAKTITKDQFREVMPKLVWLSNSLHENT
ncbi:ATP-binding protein [Paracidovorax sp. MALMAid1276]|uniref:ATP-binding protein n=1 Tax=Paracidovorax sp. MALMAid1276 TaxID=3411631 RepID=UPI003B9AAC5F